MTIRNTYSLIGITALLIGIAVIFFMRKKETQDKVFVTCVTQRTEKGWGYQIMADNRVYIRQEFIPAIAGNKTFRSEEDAKRVGDLVVKKISAGQNPAVNLHELDSLGIQ